LQEPRPRKHPIRLDHSPARLARRHQTSRARRQAHQDSQHRVHRLHRLRKPSRRRKSLAVSF
jgi:hypothetical protein